MSKLFNTFSILALASLGIVNASANIVFDYTNSTVKYGFVINSVSLDINNQKVNIDRTLNTQIKDAYTKFNISYEFDYAYLGNSILFGGVSYAKLGSYSSKLDELNTVKFYVNSTALYTGLRTNITSFGNGDLYGSAAIGVSLTNYNYKNLRRQDAVTVETENFVAYQSYLFTKLSIGYATGNYSAEFSFMPFYKATHKLSDKTFKFDTGAVVFSLGYTF